ncbi:hypothetical protein R3P38DRAFT_2767718 [Favolaschia claudopus]|uniref:Uncharacterized protein n=1 Tax=Favolaschia claudopus TaxID=2862362 RepID=A0AAW0CS50_9AGAR
MPTKYTQYPNVADYESGMLSFPPMTSKYAPPTRLEVRSQRESDEREKARLRMARRRAELKSRPLAEQAAAAERERKYHAVYRAKHREKLRSLESQRRLDQARTRCAGSISSCTTGPPAGENRQAYGDTRSPKALMLVTTLVWHLIINFDARCPLVKDLALEQPVPIRTENNEFSTKSNPPTSKYLKTGVCAKSYDKTILLLEAIAFQTYKIVSSPR